jgi:hypothetical protein
MKKEISETELLDLAETKGPLGKAAIYTKLSGPGWLQGAITLGGGSLAGALYLGVIAGFSLMWLQLLAEGKLGDHCAEGGLRMSRSMSTVH